MRKDTNRTTVPRTHEVNPKGSFSAISPPKLPSKSLREVRKRNNIKTVRTNRTADAGAGHPMALI